MSTRLLLPRNLKVFFWLFLLLLSRASFAQSVPSYVSNLADNRFEDADEDWTSPALTNSHLKPIQPMVGFVNEEAGYSVSLVRLQWRRGDPIDLWIMKPAGLIKPPVILSLYGYPSDTDIFQDAAWQKFTTKGGFVSVGFVTAFTGQRYHDIPWKKWFLSELQESLAVSSHDVQMVLDYLASRGDLDMDRVGVVGQLSGASIAILASAVDPRIKVLDILDPWGDWPTWMEMSRFPPDDERQNFMRQEFLSKVAPLDPVGWMAKVQAQEFRLQQRKYDRQTPLASKQKLRAAVPDGTTVAFYETPNEFDNGLGKNGEKSLEWIKSELKSLRKGKSTTSPQQVSTRSR